jgi:5-methylcytosine-specific restriction endonuclease McrA
MKQFLKESAVSYKGGCCQLCGYKRCISALHFHHINPHEKDFNISEKSNWYDISHEIDKCILLCANCHAEVHAGMVDLEILVQFNE